MSNLVDVSKNFDQFIADGIVLVDFFATWCGPCKMLAPVLEDLQAQFPQVKFGKVDVDQAMDIAKRLMIRSIPDVRIYKNGMEVEHIIGFRDQDELAQIISKHI